jgi:hypothetical protein
MLEGGRKIQRAKLREENVLTNTFFESKVDQILDVAKRFGTVLEEARLGYRVVGGLAVFIHVDRIDPLASRMTRDVDVAIRRSDLARIREALEPHGFRYRHVAGVDMFVHGPTPKVRSAVHLLFIGERVRASDLSPIPGSEPIRSAEGILLAPVADLVRMKLTSFRLKDKVHIQDMDSVGLITPEIEQLLPETLRERLQEVRATP